MCSEWARRGGWPTHTPRSKGANPAQVLSRHATSVREGNGFSVANRPASTAAPAATPPLGPQGSPPFPPLLLLASGVDEELSRACQDMSPQTQYLGPVTGHCPQCVPWYSPTVEVVPYVASFYLSNELICSNSAMGGSRAL